MKEMKRILLLVLLGLLIYPVFSEAKTYINWNAEYYVDYPEDWYQVPYGTVDFFLNSQGVDPETYTYDVVLAESGDAAFFNVPYAFLHFQPVGKLSRREIDSVLDKISKEYGNEWAAGSLKDIDRSFGMARPVYDKKYKAVVVKSRITSDVTDKYMLEIRKFFKNGVFVLLGYAPEESFEKANKVFLGLLHSFSDENLEAMAPKDSFKVVDVSTRTAPTYNEEDFQETATDEGMSDSAKIIIYIAVLIVIMAAVIAAIFIKKKKSLDTTDN